MKKKTIALFAALAFVLCMAAKDRTVVVRPTTGTTNGSTEVTSHEGEDSDTLTVTLGTGITTITVTVRDLDGTLLQQNVLSALGDHLSISTPSTPNGCVVTLRDDDGVVYCETD